MLTISLSIAACLGWGIADFIGGLKSRELPTLAILIVSISIGTFGLGLFLILTGPPVSKDLLMLWAIPAGLIGLIAMFLLYRSLAVGSMSILAPISATGVILPVIWGIFHGDNLSGLKMLGIAAAILGTIMAAMEKKKENNRKKWTKGIELALAAAFFIGLYFITMDHASQNNPMWASMIMRTSTLIFLIPTIAITRTPIKIAPVHLPMLCFMGIADTMAALAFAVATSSGMLSIVAVISSLYPAVTVLLSAIIIKERLQRIQSTGVVLALIGVVLISGF